MVLLLQLLRRSQWRWEKAFKIGYYRHLGTAGAALLQWLGKENAQENGHLTRNLVGFMQQAMKRFGERPDVMGTEELRQVFFNENEDRHLTRSAVEFLQLTKKTIEERPNIIC
jgi:hypothetical protein